jgi:oligosaccharide repeat unit polymerase
MVKRSVPLGFLCVITGILATGLAGVLGLSQLAVGLGAIASLVALVVILRIEEWAIISLPSSFASLFIAYNLAPTVEMAFGSNVEKAPGLVDLLIAGRDIPLDFVALLSCISLAAFAFGLWVSRLQINGSALSEKPRERGQRVLLQSSAFYILGVSAFVIGFSLNILDMMRIGGIQAIFMPRPERLYSLAEARGSLPSAPFVFAGLAVASLGWLGYGRRRRGLFLGLLVLFWIAFLFIQGDRRFILYTLLVFAGVAHMFFGFSLKLNMKVFLALLVLYVVFSLFGAIRWMLVPLFSGTLRLDEAWSWFISNLSWAWFLPSSGEFMGPYFSLVMTLTEPEWLSLVNAPLFGLSYFYAIPNLLPRSVFPGEKWEPLSTQLADYVFRNYLPPEFSVPVGFGFNPIAEAIINFGANVWAPALVFFLLGWGFGWLKEVAKRNPLPWGVIYALTMPQAFNLNRIDFLWSFQEAVYYSVVALSLLYLAPLVVSAVHRARKGVGGGL